MIFFSSYCPLDFYKSESFISMPLLSALNSGHFKPNVFQPSEIESRSFNGARSLGYDYTRVNSDELEKSIRFASLGYAAKNIFQDMVVRRVMSVARLWKLASNIWDSWLEIGFNSKLYYYPNLYRYSQLYGLLFRVSSNTMN